MLRDENDQETELDKELTKLLDRSQGITEADREDIKSKRQEFIKYLEGKWKTPPSSLSHSVIDSERQFGREL
jgi:hypothetical protein